MYVCIKSMYCEPLARKQKNEGANLAIDSLLRGGYLRLPMSLTIAVVTLRTLCQEWDGAEAITLLERE